MQWDDSVNAGFSVGEPWLPVNNNFTDINVKAQEADANSVLNHFRALTKLRTDNMTMIYGHYTLLLPEHEHVYAYTRSYDDKTMVVILNFSETLQSINVDGLILPTTISINNYPQLSRTENVITLLPFQAIVLA